MQPVLLESDKGGSGLPRSRGGRDGKKRQASQISGCQALTIRMSLTCAFCQTVEDFDLDLEEPGEAEEYIASHIAGYACSSCRSAGKRIAYDDTIYVCPTCGFDCMVTREDEGIDGVAVGCDGTCEAWYHASCALGYEPADSEDHEVHWLCVNCAPAAPKISSTRKPKKAKKTLPETAGDAVDDASKLVLLDSFEVPDELRPYFLQEKKVSASRDVELRTKYPEVHAQLLLSGTEIGRLRKRNEQKQQQPVDSSQLSPRSKRREKRTQVKAQALAETLTEDGGRSRGRKRRTKRRGSQKRRSRRTRKTKKRRGRGRPRGRRTRTVSAESEYEDEDVLARISQLEEMNDGLRTEVDDLKVRMETLEEKSLVGGKRERSGGEDEEDDDEVNDPPAKKRRRVISRN